MAATTDDTDDLETLVVELLVYDPDGHAKALYLLSVAGDRRAISQLTDVLMIREIGSN